MAGSSVNSTQGIQGSQDAGDDSKIPLLTASVHDIRYLASLLRALSFSNRATVSAYEGGLIVSVEESRTLLATAYIQNTIFDEFVYSPESVGASAPTQQTQQTQGSSSSQKQQSEDAYAQFEIPLNAFLECLNIFGTAGPLPSSSSNPQHKKWKKFGADSDQDNIDDRGDNDEQNRGKRGKIDQFFTSGSNRGTGMRLSYPAHGYPLTLLIAEDSSGPMTTCEITTFDAEPQLELPFDNDDAILKIIMKSSWLREALSELDPSYEKLTFIASPPPDKGRPRRDTAGNPLFRILAVGAYGSTEIDYPDDREVLETFQCEEPVKFSYRVALITRTLKVLQSSSKTSLRINEEGLLGFQFLVPSNKQGCSEAYIDFRCLPLDEDV